MASKKNRKLSGAVLTGALVAPAVMSAAQQNVASADFNSFLSSAKEWSSWALNGAKQVIKSAWSTTYGKIGLCTLASVALCGVVYLLDKLILDNGEFFNYREISFSEEESKACISFAEHFSKKPSLAKSLKNLLTYLKSTENTKDVSINLLIKNENNKKLQTKIVSKGACVRALKKTLNVFFKAANESQEELEKQFSAYRFGQIFKVNLMNEGLIFEGDAVVGFQIPEVTKTVTSPENKDGEANSAGLNNFKENKVDKNHFFDENYKNSEIEPYKEIKEDIL